MKKISAILCALAVISMLTGCAAYVGGYPHHHYYGPGAGVYIY
jgi:hypothetical protein